MSDRDERILRTGAEMDAFFASPERIGPDLGGAAVPVGEVHVYHYADFVAARAQTEAEVVRWLKSLEADHRARGDAAARKRVDRRRRLAAFVGGVSLLVFLSCLAGRSFDAGFVGGFALCLGVFAVGYAREDAGMGCGL